MIQNIAPHRYQNEMSWKQPEAEDWLLSFDEKARVCMKVEDGKFVLPTVGAFTIPAERLQYLVAVDDRAFFLLKDGTLPEDGGFRYEPSALLRELEPRHVAFGASAGQSLARWYRNTRFCGRCGRQMQPSTAERAMVCPDCGYTIYPRINPAIIAAVTDGDRLVLTRYKNRPFKKYALVAGFAEIGESIEDTVRREVFEETGLHVGNIRFYKSQPWVFTDTLLMGFYCELAGSDRITVQEDELAEAGWFPRDEIPEDHSNISLTGEMIERFRQGKEKTEEAKCLDLI